MANDHSSDGTMGPEGSRSLLARAHPDITEAVIPEAARSVAKMAQKGQSAAQTVQTAGSLVEEALGVEIIPNEPSIRRGLKQRLTDLLSGSERLAAVRYDFIIPQSHGHTWHVVRMSCQCELSRIYELQLELVCDEAEAPVDEMLGASCELTIERDDAVHSMYGIITDVHDLGPDQDRRHASIRALPAFGLLAHEIDTRIFQGQSVIEILTEVLGQALGAHGRTLDASTFIQREYDSRDYCLQFRESTLDFCCRLMEEEGIAFHFISDDENLCETLVLVDDNRGYPLVTPVGDDEVSIIEHNPEEANCESIQGLEWRQRHQLNKVSGRAYNFKNASNFDEHEAEVEEPHNHQPRALYVHDTRRQITDDPVGDPNAESFDGAGLHQRQRLVEQVLEEHRSKSRLGTAHGNITSFRPGAYFRLSEHHREDLDGADLLLVRVHHRGEGSGAGGSNHATYANELTVIPMEQQFRPPRRIERPKVYGSQLAKVVGPEGQEIHTDKLGRIKVQFHHDRLQPADETASCWMRVVQPWAGPQWGSFFIPRIGMEVMVQFVDGNPDCPVVVGSVYNSDNMPPYTMPDEKTKSTIKTSSSPGNGGYNELTFEDAAGSEQIIIHAQKDLDETVENNHTTTVHANQTDCVDVNRSVSVGGDQSFSVTGDHSETVTGKVTITVHKERTSTIDKNDTLSVGGDRSHTVTGHESITTQKTRSLTVLESTSQTFVKGLTTLVMQDDDNATVMSNKSVSVMGSYTTGVAGPYSLSQGGAQSIRLGVGGGDQEGQQAHEFDVTISNPNCGMTMLSGDLAIGASSSITLGCGEASITLKSDGTIELIGTKVVINGGGAMGEWSASGAVVSGNMLDLSANAVAKLGGTMVKIN